MRTRLTAVVVLTLILCMVPITAEEDTSDYTLMIYMNGSDLESEYMSATADLLEMIDGRISDGVKVILQTGGTKVWHSHKAGLPTIRSDANQRWLVTDDGMTLLETVESTSMGDASTLMAFMDYAKTNYPSDQYGLVMWNHGAGAVYGYGADELYGHDTLTLKELQLALEGHHENNPSTFDFIGFDACLMASVETASVVAPYARLLIGSEELEPVHGWNYETLMTAISSQPDPSPESLGRKIVDGMVDQAESVDTRDALTVSMIDLNKIPEVLQAMDGLFTRVAEGLDNSYYQDMLLKSRLMAESYGEGSEASDIPDSDMVDLIDYAISINDIYPYQAEQLVLAVDEAVIYSIDSAYKPEANGLSVYIPARDTETMSMAGEAMMAIGMPEGQINLIDKVDLIINGTSHDLDIQGDVDAVDSQEEALAFNTTIEGDNGFYHFDLGKGNLPMISEINTIMGKIDASGDIQYLFMEEVDEQGILEDGIVIGETASQLVKVNGTIAAMYYEGQGPNSNRKYYIPITLNGEDADLIVLIGEDYPFGKILGARTLNNDNENIYNRNLLEIRPEDRVEVIFEYDHYDLLSGSYTYDDWFIVETIDTSEDLTLSWHPLPTGEYAYAFSVSDIYGNTYQTDWIAYKQSYIGGVKPESDEAHLDHYDGTEYGADFLYPWDKRQEDAPSDWALPHVSTAYNNGLVTDRTQVGFTTDITREGFCELVVNMYEIIIGEEVQVSVPVAFEDTGNPAVAKAFSLGIVSGYGDGNFGPDDLITREQLIAMFYRALVRLDADYGFDVYQPLTFMDINEISEWAVTPSEALVQYDLIDGVGDNRLAPMENATVEQSLKLVNGVYEFYVSTHR